MIRPLKQTTSTFLFTVLTSLLIVISFISYTKIKQYEQSVNWVIQSSMVKGNLEGVISNLKDAETGQRGYLLSADSVFLEPFIGAEKRILPLMAVLDSLTNDNLIQHNNLKILKPLVEQRLMLLKANLDKLHNRQPNKIADALLLNSKYKMDEVRRQVAKMLHQEDTLLKQRIQFKNRSESFPPVLLLLLSLFSILIITLFFFRLQKETRMRILLDESNRLLHEAKQQIEASAQDLKRYKHMADNATEPFILMRQDGTFAYLNELALQRWGYTKEEAQHLRVPDVDPIYNDEVFNQAFEEAQKATLPQFETTHKKKNGTIYPVEINMGGLTLEGKPHLFAIARDITERKKLEEAIRENQEKIRSFILQAPVAMCLYRGPQHIIEIVNEELLSIWDKPLDSVINKPVFEALPEARGQGFEALLDKVYTTGEKFVAFGIPIVLSRNGKPKTIYVNLVYQAYREVDGTISGIVEVVSDATEQVVATQQIEASENQFRTFADSIQSLAWIANADGWIYWYNQRWYDYTGTTLEEMQGWGWDKVHHPDHIKGVVEFVKEAWKKDEPFELTFPLRRHDGVYRWFLTRAYPVKDANGTIDRWIGTNTDITEQKSFTETLETKVKERTAELEERKNFVETILETTKEYIAVYSNDFTLLTINTATEEMMGKKREELIGKKLFEIMPNAKGTKAEKDLQSAFNGNSIHNEPYQSPITGRYIENYITPLKDSQGKVYAALAIANDVTNIALKQKEIETVNSQLQLQNQTFELAESIAQFGSYTWNITTGALKYSDNLFSMLGYEPDAFVPTFEKFLSFIHPDDLQDVISNGEQTMITGELVETPYRIISNTGELKYFRSSGKFYGEGVNRLLIGTVQDISKDVLASKELQTKNLELENANAELASFSYVASHDLQEPLRKIQAFSKRIIEKEAEHLSDAAKDYFNRINSAAQRMQNLIESLLNFSRTNTVEIVFVQTDLNQTLKEVRAILHETIEEKNAVIESQHLPTLRAVPVQMQQLFLNLIGNALKYSKHDVAPLIKITAEQVTINEISGRVKQNGIFWKIEISDNGIGFEQQYENKIFELFQRLHGKSEYEGTGIGLAICKKIVQSHNGTITATGISGVGSTFTFYLSDNNKS